MNLTLGNTKVLIEEAKKEGLLRNQLAYLLATAYWETGRSMQPVKEAYYLKVKDLEGWRKRNLRYYPWYGRGYVQLTWERNYKFAGNKLSVDLVNNKDLALDPVIAAKICIFGMKEGWFTGKKLSDYITLKKSNFLDARRIINSMDEAENIADIAKTYDNLLKDAGYGSEMPVKAPEKVIQPIPDNPGVIPKDERKDSVEASPGFSEPAVPFIESLLKILSSIFGAKK